MNDEKDDGASLLPGDPSASPATTEALPNGPRYCPMCDEYTKARDCKACGMPTEKVPTK